LNSHCTIILRKNKSIKKKEETKGRDHSELHNKKCHVPAILSLVIVAKEGRQNAIISCESSSIIPGSRTISL
jgi:hypothetical protein